MDIASVVTLEATSLGDNAQWQLASRKRNKDKSTPFSINSMISQVLYQAVQGHTYLIK